MPDAEQRRFSAEDLSGAVFDEGTLAGAHFRETFMPGVRMTGVVLVDAVIDGLVHNLTVNGVEVTGYVAAELDRRFPVRPLLRSADLDDLRSGWATVLADWQRTAARIADLPAAQEHVSVDGEWSAVQTLQHLVFVADAWFRWTVLGLPRPFHRIGLAAPFVPDQPAMGLDPEARPSLAEVLQVRVEQQQQVSDHLAGLDPTGLERPVAVVDRPGWPTDPEQHTALGCLHVLLEEEFAHHQFCVRDLDVLAARDGGVNGSG